MNRSFVVGVLAGLVMGGAATITITGTSAVAAQAAHDSGVVKPTGAIIRALQETAERQDDTALAQQIALLNTRWQEFEQGGVPPEGFLDEVVQAGHPDDPDE
jgi:hypothetical protein